MDQFDRAPWRYMHIVHGQEKTDDAIERELYALKDGMFRQPYEKPTYELHADKEHIPLYTTSMALAQIEEIIRVV